MKNSISLEELQSGGQKKIQFIQTILKYRMARNPKRRFCNNSYYTPQGQITHTHTHIYIMWRTSWTERLHRNISGLSISFGGLPIGHSMMLLQTK